MTGQDGHCPLWLPANSCRQIGWIALIRSAEKVARVHRLREVGGITPDSRHCLKLARAAADPYSMSLYLGMNQNLSESHPKSKMAR
jgi:hypothetical protein